MNWSWRKWFRVIHRDFGYLFFGVTLVYAISGIAVNHLDDWNPNYIITTEQIQVSISDDAGPQEIKDMLKRQGIRSSYKNHYVPEPGTLKIFLKDGNIQINTGSGRGVLEMIRKRPLFNEVNYLHYNPVKWWTYFSDLYCVVLILLGITGLFLVRGNKGISGRGAWLTLLGILIPVIYLIIYYY